MKYSVIAVVAVVSTLWVEPVAGQGPCDDSLQLVQCFQRIADDARAVYLDRTKEEVRQLQFPSGVVSARRSFRTSIEDFTPAFGGGFLLENVAEGLQGVTARFHRALGNQILRLDFQANKPELGEGIRDSLSESSQSVDSTVEGLLASARDIELSLGLELLGQRQFGTHGAIADEVASAAVDAGPIASVAGDLLASLAARRSEIMSAAQQACPGIRSDASIPSLTIRCLGAERARVLELTERSATEFGIGIARLDRRLLDVGLFGLAALINNEPQFTLEARTRLRSSVVGADEVHFKARGEWGFIDVGRLQRQCAALGYSADCVGGFFDDAMRRKLLRGYRIYAELGGERVFANDVDRADLGLALSTPAAWRWSAEAGMGWGVGGISGPDFEPSGRIDFVIQGVASTDQSSRRDHVNASVTYSTQVLGNLDLSLGLRMANRSELLTDVDWPLSSLFGISYRLGSSSSDAADGDGGGG